MKGFIMLNGVNFCSVNNVHSLNSVSAPSFKGEKEYVAPKMEVKEDSFELQHKEEGAELSKADKQEIAKKARANAAGWAVFGNIFSTLYYGLRSDKTIADKYDLDAEKDKDFIKQLRRDQVKWTLPCLLGPEAAVVGWIYNKVRNPEKIDV